MKLITVYMPEPYIKALDKLVQRNVYPNRAEAIRLAVRDMLVKEVGIWDYEKKREKRLVQL